MPRSFWRKSEVQVALARRDVAELFRRYLTDFSDCTQTQLALLTEHDRSDVSNWIRGTRHGQVSDINVLTRIAEGLQVPDDARMLMGLAPADTLVSSIRDERELTKGTASVAESNRTRVDGSDAASTRIAICGSRSTGTESRVIDAAVRSMARLVMVRRLLVNHGPIGVGIEVITHIADHYQPPGLRGAVAIFGRRNVVFDAEYVVIIGGGSGTQAEADIAASMGKRILPLGASGGSAEAIYHQALHAPALSDWMPMSTRERLHKCSTLHTDAGQTAIQRMTDDFVYMIDDLVGTDEGDHS
ncbi:hypothetical protein E0H73_42905 [Kribbella pittospori]|uniref:XRE family transcriptional regulator n=1 Tax=Kribbella pittospori TaxID=722689 RepID=A0A4R0JSG9_9ACTN|nr:hypothetical protein [Kribbella pittospori]TCC48036.1 hypothetical protein E0H73_42905 [Kribbella pittospori]